MSNPLTARRGLLLPIAWKLALLLLLVSLIPLTASTVINLRRGIHTVEALALDSLELLAKVTATEIDRLILDVGKLQQLLARHEQLVAYCAAPADQRDALLPPVQRLLESITQTNPDIASAFIAGPDGVGIASTSQDNVGQDLNFRDYMQAALQGNAYTSEILVGKTTRRPGVYFSGPVRDHQQTLVGVLVLKLAGERIHDICTASDIGGQGFVALLDRDGIILAHPDPKRLYHSLAPLDPSQQNAIDAQTRYGIDTIESAGLSPDIAESITAAITRGSQSFLAPDTGETVIVSYAPMRQRDWVVGVLQPRSDFDQPLRELERQQTTILLLLGFLIVLVGLMLSRRFVRPIQTLTHAAVRLAEGDFSARAPDSASRDEVGQLTVAFNDMVPKLQERASMAHSLRVAQDIQQNLLPKTVPNLPGLDVAGKNIPADQTGGDYFDYLDLSPWNPGQLAIAIGDITGHGIPAALLMCTARSLLRAQATPPKPLPQLFAAVNPALYHDSPPGRFMTLMYAVLDRPQRRIELVSAGHDGILVYDPDTDAFFEIEGHDIPLAIDPNWQFTQTTHDHLPENAILLFGTDGIWECRRHHPNGPSEGDMYGKDPLYALIRQHQHAPAQTLLGAILEDLLTFRGGPTEPQLDDITLVIAKLTPLPREPETPTG